MLPNEVKIKDFDWLKFYIYFIKVKKLLSSNVGISKNILLPKLRKIYFSLE